ncbi:BREX-2 system phosphatase PglZ [Arthrobacter gengyunqii]|uniref:BREX-2 system phosphatase PglZ n=1 Tax=Arthrobacter gengyunqii TaxID=2886940 RepID=A0A9X1M556_9MICC|nr:BREX-2 system phosphatase PglZ [Arthrobacter gengyunqii]MCC3271100.1 BREX-2 system phosphatase PglZ [Arthrobacter gengyunqii]UOY96798.1 BREX-2 system phosphatase PglZ [Arthrobacter gengyunqii]
MSIAVGQTGAVSNAVVRSLVANARKHSNQRVLAVRGEPAPDIERRLTDAGQTIHVLPCVSALAMRDALYQHTPEEWLVIVTDRSEEDLGPGLLSHFAFQRIQAPGAWDAVRERFSADRLDRALAQVPHRMAVAQGLLTITPDDGWPAAPGSVLTKDHAFGAVATRKLGLPAGPLDVVSLLAWTFQNNAEARLTELRDLAGSELADAVLDWLTAKAGQAQAPLRELLRAGQGKDVLPLGLALHTLTTATPRERQAADLGLARLEHLWQGSPSPVSRNNLAALGTASMSLVKTMLGRPATWQESHAALQAAERLLGKAQASDLAANSAVLPAGLTKALRKLAGALRSFPASGIGAVESAWAVVQDHALAYPVRADAQDSRVEVFHSAVRLARWLNAAEATPAGFAQAVLLQAREYAWVDVAYNDAAAGVSDEELAEGLGNILRLTEERRRSYDRAFASLLAAWTSADSSIPGAKAVTKEKHVWPLENLLPGVIAPLAASHNTLLLVLDGMSAATAAELASGILRSNEGWEEILPQSSEHRMAAVAVLPTLTTLSRASLLNGRLISGGQSVEASGLATVAKSHGIARHALFHKAPLDSSRPGLALQDDIATAIADPETKLVACVLNTIDDALDKSDPAGTTWTPETIRHLRPLLAAAQSAGRTVVLTSDHGHIVERRRGELRSFGSVSSARSRSADEGTVSADEVLVAGRRVLAEGGRAVLAVDETLRYGPVKAGYHGGASPAEVVVPIVVLVSGDDIPEGWKLAAPQEPLWWSIAVSDRSDAPLPARNGKLTESSKDHTPSLLEELGAEQPSDGETSIGAAVVSSQTFKAQKTVSGRVGLSDQQVAALLDALVSAPGTRMPRDAAAVVLQVPAARINGAVAQAQKLLNVEGYGVLRIDGPLVILDKQLLTEQFGVKARG